MSVSSSHPLAILRRTIGLTQKELARRVGKSYRTIQSIELGQLKLSRPLGMAIASATGVDLEWLENPVKGPKSGGKPMTIEAYQEHVAKYDYKNFEGMQDEYIKELSARIFHLINIGETASLSPWPALSLCQLDDFIATWRKEYAEPEDPVPEIFIDKVVGGVKNIADTARQALLNDPGYKKAFHSNPEKPPPAESPPAQRAPSAGKTRTSISPVTSERTEAAETI